MEFLVDVALGRYALDDLIRWGGYAVLVAIVFTETGLLVGFFLPGDSLLVTAGLVAATGALDIWVLNALLIAAAIVGDSVGYAIGYRTGPRIFRKEESRWFSRKHLIRTHEFYERHGGKTIVLARFIPIIRTFAPVVAGVGQMTYRRFLFYNVFGGIGWVTGLTWAGYVLGQTIPNIDRHIHLVVIVVVLLSVLPIGIEWWKARARARRRPAISEP
ncbi:MAG TPA: VTT domain-containing protein [Methylomirabilota bacterium]|jgi:membrane-associated protein|nr:VTT domain-containing protein [Methylomirabilota bacterium]